MTQNLKYIASLKTLADKDNPQEWPTSSSGIPFIAAVNPDGSSLSTTPAQVYSGWSYVNIITATTTVVKSGAGTLRGISINKPGTTDTLTIYDNTAASGTLIATITVIATDVWREIPANFGVGCTVVSGGTAGNYTVYFR